MHLLRDNITYFSSCFLTIRLFLFFLDLPGSRFSSNLMVFLIASDAEEKIIFAVSFYTILILLFASFQNYWKNESPFLLLLAIFAIFVKCKLRKISGLAEESTNNLVKISSATLRLLFDIACLVLLISVKPFDIVDGIYLSCQPSKPSACCNQCCNGFQDVLDRARKDFRTSCYSCCLDRAAHYAGEGDSATPEEKTVFDLQKFLTDVNEIIKMKGNGYCFLKVLRRQDRVAFIASLSDEQLLPIWQTRSIKLSLWIETMEKLSKTRLKNSYTVYRRAYWGENTGRKKISNRLTEYVVPIFYFHSSTPPPTTETSIESLTALFGAMKVEESIGILLDEENRHMTILDAQWKRSGWHNLDYVVGDLDIPYE